jgi:hypothetical protein
MEAAQCFCARVVKQIPRPLPSLSSFHDVKSRRRFDRLGQVVPRKLQDPLKYLILLLCYTLLRIFVLSEELKDKKLKSSLKTEKTTNLVLFLDLFPANMVFKLKNKSLKDSSLWLKTLIFSFSLKNQQKTRILGLESEDSTHHSGLKLLLTAAILNAAILFAPFATTLWRHLCKLGSITVAKLKHTVITQRFTRQLQLQSPSLFQRSK